MNAIKIWKSKKSVIKVEQKMKEHIYSKKQQPLILRRNTSTQDIEIKPFGYSDLQKAIFNNDIETVILSHKILDNK